MIRAAFQTWLSQLGAPAFLAWVGAPGENPRPAPGGADMECLHAMRTLAMVL